MICRPNGSSTAALLSIILIAASLAIFVYQVYKEGWADSPLAQGPDGRQDPLLTYGAKKTNPLHQKTFRFPKIELTSEFETGSLHDAVSVSKYHYSLQVGVDPANNVDRDRPQKNWFHFLAKSSFATQKSVKFTIHNFERNWAIWTHGLALAYKSDVQTRNEWRVFNATEFRILMKARGMVIEFIYPFEAGEQVAFALTFPYSLRRLQRFLNETQATFQAIEGFSFRRETLIMSNLGHPIELLTLTDDDRQKKGLVPKMKNLFPFRQNTKRDEATPLFCPTKRVYVLSARVHPSESASSFMLEGLINRLKAQDDKVKRFFRNAVLYIIPMLNPDGVVSGFTRCDANGFNLNAKYKEADLHLPSIYALKKFMRYQNLRSKFKAYIDLHSHLTRRGFFLFGNPLRNNTAQSILELPFLIHKQNKAFSVEGSAFGSVKAEESTSRKELFKLTKVDNIYTIEVNYWGGKTNRASLKANRLIQNNLRKVTDFSKVYTPMTFRGFGRNIADALLELDSYQTLPNTNAAEREKIAQKINKFYQKYTTSTKKEGRAKKVATSGAAKKDAHPLPAKRANNTLANGF